MTECAIGPESIRAELNQIIVRGDLPLTMAAKGKTPRERALETLEVLISWTARVG
jgi:hypothetical protein